jgi:hypothetical protein
MIQYTVEQRVFMYESYVKCSSTLECVRENFVVNFLGSQFQAQQAFINLIRKLGILGHFC